MKKAIPQKEYKNIISDLNDKVANLQKENKDINSKIKKIEFSHSQNDLLKFKEKIIKIQEKNLALNRQTFQLERKIAKLQSEIIELQKEKKGVSAAELMSNIGNRLKKG